MKIYVIWDSRARGDCATFWAPRENGYVRDLSKAGLYTLEEAHRIERMRGTDIAIELEVAEKLAVKHVDPGLLRDAPGLTQMQKTKAPS